MTTWRETGTLSAGGKTLEYACVGPPPGAAPTIVMLHEGLGCLALWKDWPDRIATATGCGVLAYSRAGYGQSAAADLPRPLTYMTQEALTVLPDVLNHAGCQQVIHFGHSDGGTIAALHAGLSGDARLLGAILIAPHFFVEDITVAAIRHGRELFDTIGIADRLQAYHADAEATFHGWADVWLDPNARSWNVAGCLNAIRVPVLAIQGTEDEFGTLAQIDEIEARVPATVERLILTQCRHAPHLDQPDAVLGALTRFVAGLRVSDA